MYLSHYPLLYTKHGVENNNMENRNLSRIKFTTKTTAKTSEGLKHKGYAVGELPPSFAFIYDDNKESHGITEWFNLKGLTWIAE